MGALRCLAMVLSKARRKAAEARYFANAVHQSRDVDAVEYSFNALLSAGKNVLNAVHAQVFSIERARSAEDIARVKSKALVKDLVRKWKNTVGAASATLFDVSQEARDLEVHVLEAAAKQVTNVQEQVVRLEPPPLGSATRAAVAGMLAMGALSPEIIEFKSTFELKLDPTVPESKRVQALFKQFSRGKPRSTTKTAEEYAELLELFVNYCESEIHP